MWLILSILFLAGLALTCVKLSLTKGFWHLPIALAVALFPLVFVGRTVQLNVQHVAEILSNYGIVTTICAVVITESLMVLLFSIRLMGEHFGEYRPRIWLKLALAPSLTVPAGLVLLQVIWFNMISGQAYMKLAVLNSCAACLVLAAVCTTARIFLRDWLYRLEIMVVLAFFQLIIAMFIPVIALGLEMPDTHLMVDTGATLITFITMFAAAAAGYMVRISNILVKKGLST